MRSILSMDTVQIETTTRCRNRCSNCSRFVGYREAWDMNIDDFKNAVDSMVDYPKMTGIQGGEPLLHPKFGEFCEYLRSKIPAERLGLWSTFPEGMEKYREDICATFKHVFINDHTRPDIFHHPALIAIEEVVPDKNQMWQAIDCCWAQMSWSASINPRGAWFCEIAASMSMLFAEEDRKGWKVEPGWWWRTPKDFGEQMEMFCTRCGYPAKMKRRASIEGIDDLSPKNYDRVKDFTKIANGKYAISDLQIDQNNDKATPMAAYKDTDYRNQIAKRYGIHLFVNEQRFWSPILLKDWKGPSSGVMATIKQVEVAPFKWKFPFQQQDWKGKEDVIGGAK
jgi:hypothetical protein